MTNDPDEIEADHWFERLSAEEIPDGDQRDSELVLDNGAPAGDTA